MEIKVLFEDNHLIAVFKPAGILVQGDSSGDETLMDGVKKYLKTKYEKKGNVFLGLVHRLDRNVSGIVVFAKTSKGASRLSEEWRNREVRKIYHAWVTPVPRLGSGVLTHYLSKNSENNYTHVHDDEVPGSDRAELSYRVESNEEEMALLEITLGTGRSHQIRAQLAHIGSPIIGDIKYGSKWKLPNQEILLRATTLEFTKVTVEEKIKITVDAPDRPIIEIIRY